MHNSICMSIKLATESEALNLLKKLYGNGQRKHRIYAFYSTELQSIITDEHLMVIPIDERMATRAHAVFDVIYVKKLNIINLESHVSRLFKSSESVSINPPISKEEMACTIQDVLSELMNKMLREGHSYKALKQQDFAIRLCVSSGYGDFGISSIVSMLLFRIKDQCFI